LIFFQKVRVRHCFALSDAFQFNLEGLLGALASDIRAGLDGPAKQARDTLGHPGPALTLGNIEGRHFLTLKGRGFPVGLRLQLSASLGQLLGLLLGHLFPQEHVPPCDHWSGCGLPERPGFLFPLDGAGLARHLPADGFPLHLGKAERPAALQFLQLLQPLPVLRGELLTGGRNLAGSRRNPAQDLTRGLGFHQCADAYRVSHAGLLTGT
jgi:hypothetical protein